MTVGSKNKPPKGTEQEPNWRAEAELTDFDPDDELLPETPKEVVAALGFDPMEESEGEPK